MELKCESFYFYDNGYYSTVSKWKSNLMAFDNDVEKMSTAIRLFGTRQQIDRALDEYINRTELNLDEAYDFEDANRLAAYKERWQQNKEKALIINLI